MLFLCFRACVYGRGQSQGAIQKIPGWEESSYSGLLPTGKAAGVSRVAHSATARLESIASADGNIWNTALDTTASTGVASRGISRLQAAWSAEPSQAAPATFPQLLLKPTAAPFTMGGSNAASVAPLQLDDPSSLTAWLVENDLSDFWGCFRREGYNTVRHTRMGLG